MSSTAKSQWRARVVFWLWTALAVIVAFEFMSTAVPRLMGVPSALEPFTEFGWPLWFAYLTSVGEIVGSIALVIPVTRTLGGLLLTGIMVGAAFTNIANGHPGYLWLNAVLIAGSLLLAWQGRRHMRRYLPSRRPR